MTRIHLLHQADADRQVLTRFLSRQGHEVRSCDSVGELRQAVLAGGDQDGGLALIQESAAGSETDFTFLARCSSLVLGRRHLAPEGAARELLNDPCFYDDLRSAIERLAAGRPASE